MKSSYVVYSSLYTESICSAAIVKKHNPSVIFIDINRAGKSLKAFLEGEIQDDYSQIYLFVDDIKSLLPKSSDPASTIIYSSEGKQKDGNYHKRVALLWSHLFYDKTIPVCVHYTAGLQLSEDNKIQAEYFKLGVLAVLHELTDENGIDTQALQAWQNMMSKDGDTLYVKSVCTVGESIHSYIGRNIEMKKQLFIATTPPKGKSVDINDLKKDPSPKKVEEKKAPVAKKPEPKKPAPKKVEKKAPKKKATTKKKKK